MYRNWQGKTLGGLLCAAALMAGPAARAGTFTVAVIPDTQNYCDQLAVQPAAANVYNSEMQYVANNAVTNGGSIVFATHVGDVVQHGDLYPDEWGRATTAMNILAGSGIPFGVSPGNHDYDNYSHSTNSRPLAGGNSWNASFGPNSSCFAGKSWYGGSFNNGMDSYQTFSAGGKTFMNLSLEMCTTNAALNWAQGVINSHPGIPTIVTTHDYLQPGAQARNTDFNSYFGGSADSNTPDQIWSKFVTANDQVFMVVCGHAWTSTDSKGQSNGENLRIDNNNFGHPVYQVLSDLQGNTFDANGTPGVYAGGAGWLRLMTFDTTANTIHFQTYSPVLNQYAGVGSGPTFGIDPSLSDFTLAMPVQVPEPATMALLALGGLALLRRRHA